jgi:hypothetical protein
LRLQNRILADGLLDSGRDLPHSGEIIAQELP